jgi:DNA-binding response OmpR family regulator
VNDLPGATFRVLVVEDEPLIGMLIEDAVEDLGWDVVGPAATLAEALALTKSERIDCAVLDINVGGGRIFPVAELLLFHGVPLLVASGYSKWALPDCLLREGRLEKPYTSEQLRNELHLLSMRVTPRGD